MFDNTDRRTFLKGASVAAGAAAVPGLATADGNRSVDTSLNVDIDSVTVDGTTYAIAVAEDTDTGEIDGSVFRTAAGSNTVSASGDEMLKLRQDIAEQVTVPESGGSRLEPTSRTSPRLWDQVVSIAGPDGTASVDSVTTMGTESLLEEIIEEINESARESIERIGGYYIDSPAGTNCDADFNSSSHGQLGSAIEYNKSLNDVGSTAVGAALGAAIGAYVGTVPGAAVGALVGAIVGAALGAFKDSNYITAIWRDEDNCTGGGWVPEYCTPKVKGYASGYFMDENQELIAVPNANVPGVHLEDFVDIDRGYRDVEDV